MNWKVIGYVAGGVVVLVAGVATVMSYRKHAELSKKVDSLDERQRRLDADLAAARNTAAPAPQPVKA